MMTSNQFSLPVFLTGFISFSKVHARCFRPVHQLVCFQSVRYEQRRTVIILLLITCFYTLLQDGVITTWSPSLVVQRGTVVDDKASEVTRSQLTRLKRSNLWVTDSTLMTSVNMLVVSTTSRELNFYDVSSTVYKLQSRLCGEN